MGCQSIHFLHKHGLSQKKNYKKKCVNYDKSNLEQKSVKGPKDPNSAKKMPKSNIKFQNMRKNCHQKTGNRNNTNFLNKTA